ncbi:MAG: pantoate--beta-alanine ligase [Candidatus Omnitrophota bacterium]
MIVTGNIKKVREMSNAPIGKSRAVGFVPTMGALHQGHLSLVKRAKKECDFVVVSIFINPIQFGPKEDLQCYPRNFKKDIQLLKKEGVDLVFSPKIKQMYSNNFSIFVDEIELSQALCGRARPGHFKGVATVVTKLFNIVRPDIAYFGQKDYQQALVIKRMVRDLNFPVKIKVLPTVREKDNLAMSSRNIYLKPKARQDSLCLYQALDLAKKLIEKGQRRPKIVLEKMREVITSKSLAKIDYIAIVDAENLRELKVIKGKALIALAVYIDSIRLIDNAILNIK